jgi:hypothetical protein
MKKKVLGALLGSTIFVLTGPTGCTTPKPPPTAEKMQANVPDAAALCRTNQHDLEGAKRTWALEHRRQNSEVPTDTDLFGQTAYFYEKPKCPSGGNYTLGAVKVHPLCSISGHTY